TRSAARPSPYRRRRAGAADRSASRIRPSRPRAGRSARRSRARPCRPSIARARGHAAPRDAPAACGGRIGVPSAAGRLGKEDHALGVRRDLREVADHGRLAAPARSLVRDRGPHAEVELATELPDQALLVLGHGGISLGPHPVPLPRGLPGQLHVSIIPSTPTGPAPEPISRSPFATASAAI